MGKKATVVTSVTVLGAIALVPGIAQVQDRAYSVEEAAAAGAVLPGATVHLLVDGMICPLCASGLEERLGAVAAVDIVMVRISDGKVQIRERPGMRVTREEIRAEVEQAGFALNEMMQADR